ncbi:MAG: YraN family protein, partial [Proteobacteria bacterium]|nr:YraN family protein [Pseudomonadota bacterium]
EVKLRASRDTAAEAILPAQRARIARAAQSFVARDSRLHGLDLRFDVVLCAPGRRPVHIPNAWHILT